MLIGLNSILHMCVDGICAFAMVGYFGSGDNWYMNILLYNFCAFTLQMPLGFILDYLIKEYGNKYIPFFVTLAGVCLTVLGAWTHPVILGVGNALFHIGGGVCTIREDLAYGQRGRLLGIFVAPGAFGLFLGKRYGYLAENPGVAIILASVAIPVVLLGLLFIAYLNSTSSLDYKNNNIKKEEFKNCIKKENQMKSVETEKTINHLYPQTAILILCILVVILRSHVSMSMTFDWNNAAIYGLLLTLAAVLGKMAGGFAASFGHKEIAISSSLILAAVCFGFGNIPVFGILAIFLFNMTMPITLYELVITFKGFEGGMFGVLTFALFLGFLPTYVRGSASGSVMDGAIASLISLVLLLVAVRLGRRRERA